jgi:hypothetical protein
MKVNAHVWSTPVKPLRKFSVPFNVQMRIVEIVPWLEKLFKLPVHTFVTLNDDWYEIPAKNTKEGYWYCAGDFCPTDNKTVSGFEIDDLDTDFACCLVKPDIKLDDPEHEHEVIGGSYLVDFVCHNIANRILYASKENITLLDTSVPLTGYKAIVNSPLGVYGRNKREWSLIIDKCSRLPIAPNDPKTPPKKPQRTKAEELNLIHLRASRGNVVKSQNITDTLYKVDQIYSDNSEAIYNNFDAGDMGIEQLNEKMEKLLKQTIVSTERIVGKSVAKEIYGDYVLEKTSSSSSGGGTGSSNVKRKKNITPMWKNSGYAER